MHQTCDNHDDHKPCFCRSNLLLSSLLSGRPVTPLNHGLLLLTGAVDALPTWVAPKPLPTDVWSPKSCPAAGCTGLVVGLARYGRPGNKALLDLIQRKHLENGR